MDVDAPETAIEAVQAEVVRLMPVALDLIATVVESPAPSWDVYAGTLEVAEQQSGLLMIAVLRAAAGLAAVLEMTGEQVRALDGSTPAETG